MANQAIIAINDMSCGLNENTRRTSGARAIDEQCQPVHHRVHTAVLREAVFPSVSTSHSSVYCELIKDAKENP